MSRAIVLDLPGSCSDNSPVRTCLIFNPAARGEKAKRFRSHLDEFGTHCTVKPSQKAGHARALAAQAVADGFEVIVAAGGDGTVNEVLNGIGDAPEGLKRSCLGVIPLGTVNVFAREIDMPRTLSAAWNVILAGKQSVIDLPRVEYLQDGRTCTRWFAQLAGAGLDARAVELVDWSLKKRFGPLAYVYAGLKALTQASPEIVADTGNERHSGQLFLIGNGRLYGGDYHVFPDADLKDGLLEVCIFPKVNWRTLALCGPPLLLKGRLPAGSVRVVQCERFTLSAQQRVPIEVDGEWIGALPATFSVVPSALRVIVP